MKIIGITTKSVMCSTAAALVTILATFLLFANLEWYFAILGYVGIGVLIFLSAVAVEKIRGTKDPKGSLLDWWVLMLPLAMLFWFLFIDITFEDLWDRYAK